MCWVSCWASWVAAHARMVREVPPPTAEHERGVVRPSAEHEGDVVTRQTLALEDDDLGRDVIDRHAAHHRTGRTTSRSVLADLTATHRTTAPRAVQCRAGGGQVGFTGPAPRQRPRPAWGARCAWGEASKAKTTTRRGIKPLARIGIVFGVGFAV